MHVVKMNLIWLHNQLTTYMAEDYGLYDAGHPINVGESLELLLVIVTFDIEL